MDIFTVATRGIKYIIPLETRTKKGQNPNFMNIHSIENENMNFDGKLSD